MQNVDPACRPTMVEWKLHHQMYFPYVLAVQCCLFVVLFLLAVGNLVLVLVFLHATVAF